MNRKIMAMGLSAVTVAALVTVTGARAEITDQDKTFLSTASQADYNEIKLSQLAETKATSPQVKKFAEKMVSDHTGLEAKMKPYADAWGLTPASSLDADHQAEYDKLNGLSGADFDKEYMSAMEMDHMKAEDLFKMELSSTSDAKFKKSVEDGEKVVEKHKGMADKLTKM